MNAVNQELSLQFEAALADFEKDDDLWVGIVRSSTPGKIFCAGADLKAVNKGQSVDGRVGGFAGFVAYPRTKVMALTRV